MAETLTESFCESCGTRYEFAAPTRLNPLRKTRGLFGGIKNYLTGGEALGDAIGDAIRSEEETLAAAQLDAFHATFSFCISCRQYTCNNCWNTDAGRCRSCAPVAALTGLATGATAAVTEPVDVGAPGVAVGPEPAAAQAWPSLDLPAEAILSEPTPAWPAADDLPGAAVEPGSWADVELPTEAPMAGGVTAEPWLSEADEPVEPVAAEILEPVEPVAPEVYVPEPLAPEPMRVSTWDDDTVMHPPPAPEPGPAAEPEPVAAEAPPVVEILPVSETLVHFPAPPAAPAAPEPAGAEPVVPTPIPARPTPVPRPQAPEPVASEPVAASAGDAEIDARRAKLDLLGLGDPGEGPVTPQRPAVLPYRSRGASVHQGELAQRAALAGTLWAASAREVTGTASHVGVQACGECGLSLSASARFCRRCGTRQARSA